MRYFFLQYGWFFQNLGKEAVRTFMHTTVEERDGMGLNFFLQRKCVTGFSVTVWLTKDFKDVLGTGSQTDPCFQNKNVGCKLTVQLFSLTLFLILSFIVGENFQTKIAKNELKLK